MKNYRFLTKRSCVILTLFSIVFLFNIFANVDFHSNKIISSISLSSMMNVANAQDENGGNCYCGGVWQDCSLPCDYGNGYYGDCFGCAFWNPYERKYIPGLYIACIPFSGGLCIETDCVPGQC